MFSIYHPSISGWSHEVIGCADPLLPYIVLDGRICHTLLISPPGCGKTTMIRDLIRQISDGNEYIEGCSVGVVDERSELGGCYMASRGIIWVNGPIYWTAVRKQPACSC